MFASLFMQGDLAFSLPRISAASAAFDAVERIFFLNEKPETNLIENRILYDCISLIRPYMKTYTIRGNHWIDFLIRRTFRFEFSPKFSSHKEKKCASNIVLDYAFECWKMLKLFPNNDDFIVFRTSVFLLPFRSYFIPYHEFGYVLTTKPVSSPREWYEITPEFVDLRQIEKVVLRNVFHKTGDLSLGILASDRHTLTEMLTEVERRFGKIARRGGCGGA